MNKCSSDQLINDINYTNCSDLSNDNKLYINSKNTYIIDNLYPITVKCPNNKQLSAYKMIVNEVNPKTLEEIHTQYICPIGGWCENVLNRSILKSSIVGDDSSGWSVDPIKMNQLLSKPYKNNEISKLSYLCKSIDLPPSVT